MQHKSAFSGFFFQKSPRIISQLADDFALSREGIVDGDTSFEGVADAAKKIGFSVGARQDAGGEDAVGKAGSVFSCDKGDLHLQVNYDESAATLTLYITRY